MPAMLELNDIAKTLERDGRALFRHVSATVDESEAIHLIGASGQGKSSLLRILARLDAPDEGGLSFRGKPAAEWDPRAWRRRIGYVAQASVMLEGTVGHNLRLPAALNQETYDAELADRLIRELGLQAISEEKTAGDLSGGEKQRLSLIRTLLMKPEILLLDEVTASLDAHHTHAVEQLLLDWRRENGTSLIWVTHSMEQARRTGTRVWFLAGGGLAEDRATEDFFKEPHTDAAKRFLDASGDSDDQPSHAGEGENK